MDDLSALYNQWLSLPNDATRYAFLSQGGAGTSGLQNYITQQKFGGDLNQYNSWLNNAGINGGYTAGFTPSSGAYSYMTNGARTIGNLANWVAPGGAPVVGGPVSGGTNNPWVRGNDVQNPWIGSGGGNGTAPTVTTTPLNPTTPLTPTTPVLTSGTPMTKNPTNLANKVPVTTGINAAQKPVNKPLLVSSPTGTSAPAPGGTTPGTPLAVKPKSYTLKSVWQ